MQGGLADGAQFVLAVDDTVVATYAWDDTGASGITQYIDSYDGGAGTLYGLNLQAGFTACPGIDPAALVGAQPVAVVGTQALQDGVVTGPYYAWQFITRA